MTLSSSLQVLTTQQNIGVLNQTRVLKLMIKELKLNHHDKCSHYFLFNKMELYILRYLVVTLRSGHLTQHQQPACLATKNKLEQSYKLMTSFGTHQRKESLFGIAKKI